MIEFHFLSNGWLSDVYSSVGCSSVGCSFGFVSLADSSTAGFSVFLPQFARLSDNATVTTARINNFFIIFIVISFLSLLHAIAITDYLNCTRLFIMIQIYHYPHKQKTTLLYNYPPIGLWASRIFFYFQLVGRRMGVDLIHKQKTPLLEELESFISFKFFKCPLYIYSNNHPV